MLNIGHKHTLYAACNYTQGAEDERRHVTCKARFPYYIVELSVGGVLFTAIHDASY